MRKTISQSTNYFYEHIINILSGGNRTAIPKDVLEKEGLDLAKLNRYFFTKQGPYGLIHFIGIKKSIV